MNQHIQQQIFELDTANDKEAHTMFISKTLKKLHNDQSGASALETAIILIAFVVVASVFAFTILSAGSASTEQSEESIYAGLSNVQSSMSTKGPVVALANAGKTLVEKVVFTVSLASGGEPVNITDSAADNNVIVIDYRDSDSALSNVEWVAVPVVNDGTAEPDTERMLEADEQFQITVTIPAGAALGTNTEFTLEVKPPTGAVLNINATTPYVLEPVMELR